MSHSYIISRSHSLRLEDGQFLIVGHFLCGALRELMNEQNNQSLLAENIRIIEQSFVYNGPGAMMVKLGVFLADAESQQLFREACRRAISNLNVIGQLIPKSYLNTKINVEIQFGDEPATEIKRVFDQLISW